MCRISRAIRHKKGVSGIARRPAVRIMPALLKKRRGKLSVIARRVGRIERILKGYCQAAELGCGIMANI